MLNQSDCIALILYTFFRAKHLSRHVEGAIELHAQADRVRNVIATNRQLDLWQHAPWFLEAMWQAAAELYPCPEEPEDD